MKVNTKLVVNPDCKASQRDQQMAVVQVFGERMKEARVNICGYQQQKAAELLGYKNSSKLAKIECASDGVSVPWWLIVQAAKVYDVSTDYLLGFSDDWERDPVVSQQRQVGALLIDLWGETKAAEVNALRILFNKIGACVQVAESLVERSKVNLGALESVRALNPEFDDMKGGAKLLRLIGETRDVAETLERVLKKFSKGVMPETIGTLFVSKV